jgi:hypothetical protein
MLEALDLRHVGMSVDDRLAVGEPCGQARLPPQLRAGVVNHPDLDTADLDDALPRQRRLQHLLVHVAVDAFDRRADRAQLLEELRRDEVAAVQDEIRGGDEPDAFVGQRPGPAR